MRVFHSTIGKVQGGRMEEVVGIAGEAAKLIGRHGGDVRFFLAAAAGEEVNSTVFSIEYDSPEAMGEAFDELNADAELQALMTRLNATTSPSIITSQSMGMELATAASPKRGRGSVLEVHVSRITPGRISDFIGEATEVCEFVEGNGAVNARAIQLTYAGIASGSVGLIWELENMRAHAKLGLAWYSPEGMALQQQSMAANPSNTLVSSGIYNEVPL